MCFSNHDYCLVNGEARENLKKNEPYRFKIKNIIIIYHNTLVVVHLEKTESIQIISARKATKKEKSFYEEQ